mgnify:CR=1 FL=1
MFVEIFQMEVLKSKWMLIKLGTLCSQYIVRRNQDEKMEM